MAALNWSSLGMLRSPLSLRSLFVWLLLTLLLTGAASYTHGSRYAIVPGYGPVQTADDLGPKEVPPQAEPAASPADTSLWTSQATRAVHLAAPSLGTEDVEKDCCQRRHAPRGEPAPMRTGALDPPIVTYQQPGDALLNGAAPPEPDLPALTVVELSISRT
ncbi:hypothetical protein M1E17_18385 [Arthrobacter sp. D1-29]